MPMIMWFCIERLKQRVKIWILDWNHMTVSSQNDRSLLGHARASARCWFPMSHEELWGAIFSTQFGAISHVFPIQLWLKFAMEFAKHGWVESELWYLCGFIEPPLNPHWVLLGHALAGDPMSWTFTKLPALEARLSQRRRSPVGWMGCGYSSGYRYIDLENWRILLLFYTHTHTYIYICMRGQYT